MRARFERRYSWMRTNGAALWAMTANHRRAQGVVLVDLLHRLVKKILVHDRRTLEVWYALPNSAEIENSNRWLATFVIRRV